MLLFRPKHTLKSVTAEIVNGLRDGSISLGPENVHREIQKIPGKDFMVMLLADLLVCEKSGINEWQSEQIRKILDSIINAMSDVPDAAFYNKPLWKLMAEFKDLFEDWASIEGSSEIAQKSRKEALKSLRMKRHKVATRARAIQQTLDNELSKKKIEEAQSLAERLSNDYPENFKNIYEFFHHGAPNKKLQPTSFVGG